MSDAATDNTIDPKALNAILDGPYGLRGSFAQTLNGLDQQQLKNFRDKLQNPAASSADAPNENPVVAALRDSENGTPAFRNAIISVYTNAQQAVATSQLPQDQALNKALTDTVTQLNTYAAAHPLNGPASAPGAPASDADALKVHNKASETLGTLIDAPQNATSGVTSAFANIDTDQVLAFNDQLLNLGRNNHELQPGDIVTALKNTEKGTPNPAFRTALVNAVTAAQTAASAPNTATPSASKAFFDKTLEQLNTYINSAPAGNPAPVTSTIPAVSTGPARPSLPPFLPAEQFTAEGFPDRVGKITENYKLGKTTSSPDVALTAPPLVQIGTISVGLPDGGSLAIQNGHITFTAKTGARPDVFTRDASTSEWNKNGSHVNIIDEPALRAGIDIYTDAVNTYAHHHNFGHQGPAVPPPGSGTATTNGKPAAPAAGAGAPIPAAAARPPRSNIPNPPVTSSADALMEGELNILHGEKPTALEAMDKPIGASDQAGWTVQQKAGETQTWGGRGAGLLRQKLLATTSYTPPNPTNVAPNTNSSLPSLAFGHEQADHITRDAGLGRTTSFGYTSGAGSSIPQGASAISLEVGTISLQTERGKLSVSNGSITLQSGNTTSRYTQNPTTKQWTDQDNHPVPANDKLLRAGTEIYNGVAQTVAQAPVGASTSRAPDVSSEANYRRGAVTQATLPPPKQMARLGA